MFRLRSARNDSTALARPDLGAALAVGGGNRLLRRVRPAHGSKENTHTVPWPGIHTSVRRSDSSVKFSQADLDMVTPVQTVQSLHSVRTLFSQFCTVSSGRVCVRRLSLRVGRLSDSVSKVQSASVNVQFSQSSVCLKLNELSVSLVRVQSVQLSA